MFLIIPILLGFVTFIGLSIYKFIEQYAFLRDVVKLNELRNRSELWFAYNFFSLDISIKAKLWVFLPFSFIKPKELRNNDSGSKYANLFFRVQLIILVGLILFLGCFLWGIYLQNEK